MQATTHYGNNETESHVYFIKTEALRALKFVFLPDKEKREGMPCKKQKSRGEGKGYFIPIVRS